MDEESTCPRRIFGPGSGLGRTGPGPAGRDARPGRLGHRPGRRRRRLHGGPPGLPARPRLPHHPALRSSLPAGSPVSDYPSLPPCLPARPPLPAHSPVSARPCLPAGAGRCTLGPPLQTHSSLPDRPSLPGPPRLSARLPAPSPVPGPPRLSARLPARPPLPLCPPLPADALGCSYAVRTRPRLPSGRRGRSCGEDNRRILGRK